MKKKLVKENSFRQLRKIINEKAVNNSTTSTWRHHHLLYALWEGWVSRTLENFHYCRRPSSTSNLQFLSFIVVSSFDVVAHYVECFFALLFVSFFPSWIFWVVWVGGNEGEIYTMKKNLVDPMKWYWTENLWILFLEKKLFGLLCVWKSSFN